MHSTPASNAPLMSVLAYTSNVNQFAEPPLLAAFTRLKARLTVCKSIFMFFTR
jgi:hypothetical protein